MSPGCEALKSFLCLNLGFTTEQAKGQFSHRLEKLANEVAERAPRSELAHGERYGNDAYSREELWEAYQRAQFSAAALMRSLHRL